jgi:Tol biopolymer transport system component/C-terminal processing protease CtpA/Prc
MSRKNLPYVALLILLLAVSTQSQSTASPRPYLTEPSVSPDKSEIAFVSGGDIWAVAAAGGEGRLLVSHPATESRPLYSPDGRKLAFASNRTGAGDIYVLTFASGDVQRLTFDDGPEQLDGWSRDGRWIYFSSTSHDIAGMNDVFRVSVDGGTPMEVAADRYVNEYFSSPSPDGSTIAITARAIASAQWWRNGRSHIDEAEVWLVKDLAQPKYEAVTNGGAKEMWPMWSADGKTLFYVSDRNGTQNIWTKTIGAAAPRQLTSFRDGRVLWPSISADGQLIVFEHNFEVWKLDTSANQAVRVNISRRGAPAGATVDHITMTDNIDELALSPDGKKVAFVVRGDVFAVSAKDGGDAAPVSRTPEIESNIAWSPDSRRLVYMSDRGRGGHLYLYDFGAEAETQLTQANGVDHSPKFSPDGKLVAFVRDNELRAIELQSKQERLLARGGFDRPPFSQIPPFTWSPDSRWVAYLNTGEKLFTNVHVLMADGTPARPISFLANAFSNTVSWTPDGKSIFFDTGQRTEVRQIARIDLVPRTPQFREDQFRDLFKEESPRSTTRPATPSPADQIPEFGAELAKAASKNTDVVFDDIRKRISILPAGVDAFYQRISPDGKSLLLIARAAGQQNLYLYSIDELSREPAVARQLTATPGGKRDAQFTPDGKEVFYLESGRISVVNLDSRQSRRLAVAAEMDVDFNKEKMEVFHQAWSYIRDNFFDEELRGLNWQDVGNRYEQMVAASATRDEMRRLLSLMVGELNASHMGVNSPGGAAPAVGKPGLRFDRKEFEENGRLRITEVIPLSPAAVSGIKPGQYLLQVDGTSITARTNFDELLSHKINRRVELVLADDPAGSGRREIAVRPVNQATEKNLVYRKWVEDNREYVAKASGGRLGYVHMFDMSEGSLTQLFLDLDVENHSRDAVVIDVRNNNGGFVNGYAIDVFARQNYLTMVPRGFTPAPGRSILGQRALGVPTILVTNQHSLSDAEDFTEGYRSLKLGKVVGEPTAGWIIYTSNVPLIDGTVLRIPGTKVFGSDGKPMELQPRPVDLPVKRAVGESYAGRDAQLDAAVSELLRQIAKK